MKKTFYLLAGAILLLMGCAKIQNEEIVTESGKYKVTLRATVDEQTRVSINESGAYSWQAEDYISVLTSDGTYTYGQIMDEDPGATADFEVELSEGVTLGRYAYYPDAYREGVAVDEFVLAEDFLWYRPEETFMPMLGEISANGAIFKAVGGVLKVPVNNIPPNAHILELFVEGKKISGVFPITVVNGQKQITTEDEEDGNSIFIRIMVDQEEEYDAEFYIPLPCGIYNNLTFRLYEWEVSDEYALFSKTAQITGGLEIHRNEVIITPPLNVIVEKNTPNSVEFEEPYGYTLDEDGVLHLDQYVTPVEMVARIYGVNVNKPVEEVDEGLISCTLVNVTDPEQEVETDIEDFIYDVYSGVNVTFPTDHDGVFKLKVYYDKDGDNPLSAVSCTFKVHEAALLPEALKNWKASNNDFWFSKYRVFDDDGNAYLKTYAAGTLYGTSYLYPEIPNYAGWEGPFNGAFNNSSAPGSFDAFQFFEKLTKVPNYAFSNCPYLTGITLPYAVTEIGKAAFFDCKKLTSVTLPSNLVTIGVEAFKDCKQLGQIVLTNTVTTISSEAFFGCSSLSSINIPESVTTIGEWAFGSCALNHVIITTSVSTIGDKAFGNCSLLEYAVFEGTTPPTISEGIDPVFEDGVTIYVPDGSESAYGAVFGNCTILPISQKPAGN